MPPRAMLPAPHPRTRAAASPMPLPNPLDMLDAYQRADVVDVRYQTTHSCVVYWNAVKKPSQPK